MELKNKLSKYRADTLYARSTTENKDIYVDPAGDDDTGDGTSGSPFATFAPMFEALPQVIGHRIRGRIASGDYTDLFPRGVKRQFTDDGTLVFEAIDGPVVFDAGPYTATTVTQLGSIVSLSYTIDVAGTPWTADELLGGFVEILSGANTGYLMPIFSNGTNQIQVNKTYKPIGNGETFRIVRTPVTTTQTDGIGFWAEDLCRGVDASASDSYQFSRIGIQGISFQVNHPVDYGNPFGFYGGDFVISFCEFLNTHATSDKTVVSLRGNTTIDYAEMAREDAFTDARHDDDAGMWGWLVFHRNHATPTDLDTTIQAVGFTGFVQRMVTRGRVVVGRGCVGAAIHNTSMMQFRSYGYYCSASVSGYIDPMGISEPCVSAQFSILTLSIVYFGDGVDGVLSEMSEIIHYITESAGTLRYVLNSVASTKWYMWYSSSPPTGTSGDILLESGEILPLPAAGETLDTNIEVHKWDVVRTSADREIYIDGAAGNDDTGDGSASSPYQTFSFLDNLPKIIDHEIKVKPAAGTYTYFPETISHEWRNGGRLVFDASGETYPVTAGPYTVQTVTGAGAAGRYGISLATDLQVSGAPGWVSDVYWGKYVHFLTGAYAGQVVPIWKNTSDTVRVLPDWLSLFATPMVAGDTFNIVDCPVVIDVDHRIRITGASPGRWQYIFNKENDAVINPHLIIAGFRFRATVGAQNPFVLENLNCAMVYTTWQDAWTTDELSKPLHIYDCQLNIKNANITNGSLDNQLLISDWYSSMVVLSMDGAVPTSPYGEDVAMYRGGASGLYFRRRGLFYQISFDNLVGCMIGGMYIYSCPRFLCDHMFIEQIGYTGVAIEGKSSSGRIDGAQIERCSRALSFNEGCSFYLRWVQGTTITENYAASMRRGASAWVASTVTALGSVGAVEFVFGGGTHVSWPTSGVAYSDGAGSFVGGE